MCCASLSLEVFRCDLSGTLTGLGIRAAYYVPSLQGIQMAEPRWGGGFGA